MIFMRDLSKYVAYKKVINLLPAILWLIKETVPRSIWGSRRRIKSTISSKRRDQFPSPHPGHFTLAFFSVKHLYIYDARYSFKIFAISFITYPTEESDSNYFPQNLSTSIWRLLSLVLYLLMEVLFMTVTA